MKEKIQLAETITKIFCTIMVVLTFCWMLLRLTYKTIPPENSNTVNLMIGSLGGLVLAIVGYWYGSSEGAKQNREQLNKMTESAYPTGGAIEQKTTTLVSKEAEAEKGS